MPQLVDKSARQDGAISVGPNGFESIYCGGKGVARQDILKAFLESRAQRKSITEIQVGDALNEARVSVVDPLIASAKVAASPNVIDNTSSYALQKESSQVNSNSTPERIVELVVQVKTAKD